MGQCGPEKPGELTCDGGDDVLLGFAARRQAAIAAMQAVLRVPGPVEDVSGRAALAQLERVPDEGVMPVMPGRLDEDAAEMDIAGFSDRAAGLFGAAGVFGRHQAREGHDAWRGREPTRVAEFGG